MDDQAAAAAPQLICLSLGSLTQDGNLDWLIGNWKDLITAGAAAVAAYVALSGLHTWRAQLKGKTEYDLARRLLRAVLVVRDQIASVRGPFISAGEVAAAFKEAGIEPEDEGVTLDKRADELVYDRRWRSLSKAMTDLQLELLEAEVLWGEQVRAPEEKFRRVVAEVYVAVLHHVRSRSNSANEDKLPAATREKFFQALYQTSTDPSEDPICGRVAEAIDEFEALLRPHLRLTRSQPTRAA